MQRDDETSRLLPSPVFQIKWRPGVQTRKGRKLFNFSRRIRSPPDPASPVGAERGREAPPLPPATAATSDGRKVELAS
ncbi:hypothetical protein PABG_12481 [Paracoccidioides brasiliensis Pb03]|nr:hypothetical protein PABG_12481 [Paracoccidioides brasiliensis Pb03]